MREWEALVKTESINYLNNVDNSWNFYAFRYLKEPLIKDVKQFDDLRILNSITTKHRYHRRMNEVYLEKMDEFETLLAQVKKELNNK